jgi:uncharacterized protein (TIGR02246 family)
MSSQSPDDAVRALYHGLLDAWNRRSAREMAAPFAEAGNLVGFDGSVVNGRVDIEAHLTPIFTDHVTARYVGKVREVRFLSPDVAVLRAVVGMVPPGGTDINPAVNAVQTLVAVRQNGEWRVEVYQNTPAAFHGRPDLSAALTEELRALL